MTVPTARQVLGPARKLKGWWEPDKIGAPLTERQKEWLMRGMIHKMPAGIQKELARRGLLLPPDYNDPRASRWSPEAQRIRATPEVTPEARATLEVENE